MPLQRMEARTVPGLAKDDDLSVLDMGRDEEARSESSPHVEAHQGDRRRGDRRQGAAHSDEGHEALVGPPPLLRDVDLDASSPTSETKHVPEGISPAIQVSDFQ